MNEILSKDSEAKLSRKDIISQLKIELDPNKRITSEQQHEQSVGIYEILDENYFSLEQYDGPYCLNMRTDSRHIFLMSETRKNSP